MARGSEAYEYGTSPRKIQPEYTPNVRKKKISEAKAKSIERKRIEEKRKKEIEKQKAEEKMRKKHQRKIVVYIGIGFLILFAISYRNSQIDENFSQIQKMKGELATIQKNNEQLQVSIENSSNLSNLEQLAKEMLGMQKLSNKQSTYVSLPKVDYIEEVG